MPTTRIQAAKQATLEDVGVSTGQKRDVEEVEEEATAVPSSSAKVGDDEPPAKKAKTETVSAGHDSKEKAKPQGEVDYSPKVGIIERGHIYFFYRPKVEHEEAHDLDDVQRFLVLLVPRPPAFAAPDAAKPEHEDDMAVLQDGADAVPAAAPQDQTKKRFRLISVGKKQLPHADEPGRGGRKQTLWATVTTVGSDLHALERGLESTQYETKTRGTRHQAAARLAGRGAYALVNNDPSVPSKRATHLGYHLSHPAEPGEVQAALGIAAAASFVLQLRNPRAPATAGQRAGLSGEQKAEFPDEAMRAVFGVGEKGTDKDTGLRFASVNTAELLDFEGAELLFIAAHGDDEGVNQDLEGNRGEALKDAEETESDLSVKTIFKELVLDAEQIPAEALEGSWI